MATLPRLYPNGDGTSTTMSAPQGATTYWEATDDFNGAASHDTDTTYITPGLDSGGTQFLLLTDMPADFASMDTINLTTLVRLNGTAADDTTEVFAQIFAADETTALTDELSVATQAIGNTYTSVNSVFTISGTPTKAQWDGARVRYRWTFTKLMASDGIALRITAAYVDGTYTLQTVPATPTGLTATAGSSEVALSWTASSGAEGYRVYRDGGATPIYDGPNTSYTDTGLTNGTTYSYTVSAYNGAGESAQSTAVTATPQPTPPGIPGSPAVSNPTATSAHVTWTAATNADTYKVEVSTDNVTFQSYSKTTPNLYLSVMGLTHSTAYYFRVVATNKDGDSDPTASVTTTTAADTVGTDPVVASRDQIASLSTTSAAALRAKAIADDVKGGVITAATATTSDIYNVNNKIAGVALTTALWWARTQDSTYLQPLKDYILGVVKPPVDGQALNQYRAFGGLFAAVNILQAYGQWDAAALCPNHGNVAWSEFMGGGATYPDPLPTRLLDTGTTQREAWRKLQTTCIDSASNWGGVARWAYQMWAYCQADTTAQGRAETLSKKWLGDQTTTEVDFNSTGSYLGSWDNWNANPDGTMQPLQAGLGKTDAANPGLDGVVLNDIDRGTTNYDPNAAYWGAGTAGLTYTAENLDGVIPMLATFRHAGKPVETWGEGGNALRRLCTHISTIPSGGTNSILHYLNEINTSALYDNLHWMLDRVGERDLPNATRQATASGVGGLPRTFTYGDWIAANDTTWGLAAGTLEAATSPVTLTPAVIATTLAVQAPTLTEGPVSTSPTTLSSTFTVQAATATNVDPSVTLTPAALSTSLTLQAPTTSVGAVTLSPTVLATNLTVQAPTLSSSESVAPPALAASLAVQAPTVVVGSVTTTPTVLSLALTTAAPTVNNITDVSPATIPATFTVQAPTITAGAVSVTAPTLSLSSAVSAPTVGTSGQITPPPISATFSVSTPTLLLGGLAQTPTPLSLALAVQAPTLISSEQVSPAPLTASFTLQAPTVTNVSGGVVTPAAITTTFSVSTPTITEGPVTLTPAPLSLTLTVIAPTIGAVVTIVSRGSITITPAPGFGTLAITPHSYGAITPAPTTNGSITVTSTTHGTIAVATTTYGSISVTPTTFGQVTVAPHTHGAITIDSDELKV